MNIARNNAFAATSSLKIKLVDNIIGVGQKMSDEENWIELKTEADVDALKLNNLFNFFEEADDDEKKQRDKMIKAHVAVSEARKEEKAENKKGKKDATVKK